MTPILQSQLDGMTAEQCQSEQEKFRHLLSDEKEKIYQSGEELMAA